MTINLYQLRVDVAWFFLLIALKLNSHKLCALILWVNIRKFKHINYKNNSTKRILIFPKSGGTEDLIEAFRKKKNNSIIFFWLPRKLIKKIYIHFFKNHRKHDYFTKIVNKNESIKKKLYIDFLTQTFQHLDKYLKIDGFISFNLFYYAEKHFDELSNRLNKKFFVLDLKSSSLKSISTIGFSEVIMINLLSKSIIFNKL